MTSSRGLASMATPLTVIATVVGASVSDTRGLLRRRTDEGGTLHGDGHVERSADVALELVPEPHDRGRHGRRRGLTERADGGHLRRPREADRDVVGGVHEQRDILGPALTEQDAVEDALHPRRALAARCALAARLTGEEAHEAQARLDHV